MKLSLRKPTLGRAKATAKRTPNQRQPRLMEGQNNDYVFRRSRTITGSASQHVSSTEVQRRDITSPRLKLHQLHAHRRRIALTLGCLLALAGVCLYAIGTSLAATTVRAEGNVTLTSKEEQDIESTIRSFSTAYPGQAFTTMLDDKRLASYLQKTHPDIASVYLARSPYLPLNTFVVRFRTPLVAWTVSGQQFYIDDQGTMFARLHSAAPSLTIEDASGVLPTDQTTSVASKRFIRYLGQLLGALEVRKVGTVQRVVIPASTRELDIYLEGRGYPIKTHIDRNPEGQAADVASALAFMDEQKITPSYVDVRVEGKAYYK